MLTLCLDIGGTKVAVGLADPVGALVHTATSPTPSGVGAEQVWAAVAALIADALRVAGGSVAGVGIASAGPVDVAAGTVSPINIPAWRRFPLRDRVAAMIPGCPACRFGWAATASAWRSASTGAAPGAAQGFCWAWWFPPEWAGDWCSTVLPTTAAPATPVTSVTSWCNRMACGVRAVGAAVSRPSLPVPR